MKQQPIYFAEKFPCQIKFWKIQRENHKMWSQNRQKPTKTDKFVGFPKYFCRFLQARKNRQNADKNRRKPTKGRCRFTSQAEEAVFPTIILCSDSMHSKVFLHHSKKFHLFSETSRETQRRRQNQCNEFIRRLRNVFVRRT